MANTGARTGATVVFVSYAKQTLRVVRYLRMLCGFAKVLLRPGESKTLTIGCSAADLARWDPTAASTDLSGKAVRGAYVVDGGHYDFFAGTCVSNGGVWDDRKECAELTAAATLGEGGQVFRYL